MAEKRLLGTKILMVIAQDQFRDEELAEPRKIFLDEGAEVVVASTAAGVAKGMLGARCQPDAQVCDVNPAHYDAIVIVGGMGSPTYLWENTTVHRLLQQMDKDEKVVAGICLSGAVLAKAGVLKNKEATVWPCTESLAALAEGEARYLKKPVVFDGRTVTAVGPEAAHDFGQTIVEKLATKLTRTK